MINNKKRLLIGGAILIGFVLTVIVWYAFRSLNVEIKPTILDQGEIKFITADTSSVHYFNQQATDFFTTNVYKETKRLSNQPLNFIQTIRWSPNRQLALVSVINYPIEMEKDGNPFLAHDAPEEQETWWIYQINTGKVTRLPSKIIAGDWLTNDQVGLVQAQDKKNNLQIILYRISKKEENITTIDGDKLTFFAAINDRSLGYSIDDKKIMVIDVTSKRNTLLYQSTQSISEISASKEALFVREKDRVYHITLAGQKKTISTPKNIKRIAISSDGDTLILLYEDKTLTNFLVVYLDTQKRKRVQAQGISLDEIKELAASSTHLFLTTDQSLQVVKF